MQEVIVRLYQTSQKKEHFDPLFLCIVIPLQTCRSQTRGEKEMFLKGECGIIRTLLLCLWVFSCQDLTFGQPLTGLVNKPTTGLPRDDGTDFM